MDSNTYFHEAFSRNLGILTLEEQIRLQKACIAIAGLGGVGGAHLVALARAGVGKFHLADFDAFEVVNVNRQYGAKNSTVGRSKLDVLAQEALDINPYLSIEKFPEGVTEKNLNKFLDGVDIVIDGLDFFVFDTRRMLFKRAKELGIFVITAGPLGFGCAMLVFDPVKSPDFDEYFAANPAMDKLNKIISFALGLAPKALHARYIDLGSVNLARERGPSFGAACFICAGMATVEAVRIIVGRPGLKPVPYYVQFDPYKMKLAHGRLFWGNRGPVQTIKRWLSRLKFKERWGKTT